MAGPAVAVDTGDYLLIQDGLQMQHIRLVEVRDDTLVHLQDGLWMNVDLRRCIAVLDTTKKPPLASTGLLVLADGQRFPGAPIPESGEDEDVLSWNHRWLGRLDVSLDDVRSVHFRPGARIPSDGSGDVVILGNGDRLDGLIVSLNDPLVIEQDLDGQRELVEVPRANVAAVRLVSVAKTPSGRRVWMDDGTVLDVSSIQVGDDGFVRLRSKWHSAADKPVVLRLADLDSILLDAERLLPLAAITPSRVQGPATRYLVPDPLVLEPDASLQVSPIEIRGPLVARYTLPDRCRRFAAEAYIPIGAQTWADFELIIRSDDEEVFRARINADNPYVAINVPLSGTEMTIELTEGANGPIQDRLILDFPMLLLGDE